MSFLTEIRRRAAAAPRTIVFPEGTDQRTIDAAVQVDRDGLGRPVVLGGAQARAALAERGGGHIPVLDPAEDPRRQALAARLYERRRARGMTEDEAFRRAAEPLVFGALLVGAGEVDASVAGAINSTGDVLRAALWAVGPAAGIRTVSSSFYMVVPPFRGTDQAEVLSFTDAGVVPDPTPEQLADIASAAVTSRRRVVGDEPRVAFLSYSTAGSAGGPSVERVRAALARFRELHPDVVADGEMQADAALIASVCARKAPASPVAGGANVLVFPDLDAGNIAYKLVQRLAGAEAVGPIIQGLARPCNDLSRGADVEDVVNVACITGLMAAEPGAVAPPVGAG